MKPREYKRLCMQSHVTVKQALRMAMYLLRIAQETGNRELRYSLREFIRNMWSSRHSKSIIVMNRGKHAR